MPHSSGGGSHSGGSHSSHSSSHSSSHGGSSSRPRTVRSTYFNGARRFVRYSNHGAQYMYADYDLTGKSLGKVRYFLLIFYIPFIIAIFGMLGNSIHMPKKVVNSPENLHKQVMIWDSIGAIDDDVLPELEQAMQQFEDKTGIEPALVTLDNSKWLPYTTLENYAYEYYLNLFNDEKHWLLVYSTDTELIQSYEDWYWEGMQGDDTDGVLTERITDNFTNKVHADLLKQNVSVGEAFLDGFNEIEPSLMKMVFEPFNFFMGLFVAGFIGFHMYFMVFFTDKKTKADREKYKDYVECPSGPAFKEDNCEYCGGLYVIGTVLSCPHCGAQLPAHNTEGVRKSDAIAVKILAPHNSSTNIDVKKKMSLFKDASDEEFVNNASPKKMDNAPMYVSTAAPMSAANDRDDSDQYDFDKFFGNN